MSRANLRSAIVAVWATVVMGIGVAWWIIGPLKGDPARVPAPQKPMIAGVVVPPKPEEAVPAPVEPTPEPGKKRPFGISLDLLPVKENDPGARVGMLKITDPSPDETYQFDIPDSSSPFEVVQKELRLKGGVSLDYEQTPRKEVIVRATDSQRGIVSKSFPIDIQDVNDAPTDIILEKGRVAARDPGARIGRLIVSDQDPNDTHQFQVSDPRFEVVEVDVLKLKTGVDLADERSDPLELSITAIDRQKAKFTKPFRIAIDRPTALKIPFITWGGDVATFLANGDVKTLPDTIFDKHGLTIELTKGDDFRQQVEDYKVGRSHFLRGTFSMLGEVSEELNANPQTEAVVFLQLTWSAGDHLVARRSCPKIVDLSPVSGRKKRVAIQKTGPHVELLDNTLSTAGLEWGDIEVVWVEELTGPGGPAARFQKDASIDACTVISPDMAALTGGSDLNAIGTGSDGTVDGAHVLNSTAWMSRSICDVYSLPQKLLRTESCVRREIHGRLSEVLRASAGAEASSRRSAAGSGIQKATRVDADHFRDRGHPKLRRCPPFDCGLYTGGAPGKQQLLR